MPAIRHTDYGPAARPCPTCRTTHRPATTTGRLIRCPPANRWLIAGPLVKGLDDRSRKA